MLTAVSNPAFSHPHVTGERAVVPTGGNRGTLLQNYANVLQYLAGHGAWECAPPPASARVGPSMAM